MIRDLLSEIPTMDRREVRRLIIQVNKMRPDAFIAERKALYARARKLWMWRV